MKIILVLTFLASLIYSTQSSALSIFKTCAVDSNCDSKKDEFCDHKGVNPIGTCTKRHKVGSKCNFDRHCASKNCNWSKCVARKPKKDGPCTKEQHTDCIETQYCSKNKCTDRKLSGTCTKSAECMSNKCSVFTCQKYEPLKDAAKEKESEKEKGKGKAKEMTDDSTTKSKKSTKTTTTKSTTTKKSDKPDE